MNSISAVPTVERRSLHHELVDRLQSLIVDGVLRAGEKVPEKALCERLGVSRTPLREALKVLASEGYITLIPNRGAVVSDVTLADLEEAFPVMGALEALSGELACANITERELSDIVRLHAEMLQHHAAGDLSAYFRCNQVIHESILAAAHNSTLSAHYRTLATRVRRARYIASMTASQWAQAVAEHEAMLGALEARDGAQLAAILKQHLAGKFEIARQWLRSQSGT